jgi:hypothetical protein
VSELQEIEVLIRPDGSVQVQVRGVKGPACLEVTRRIEELLGGQVEKRTPTDEFAQGDALGAQAWSGDSGA